MRTSQIKLFKYPRTPHLPWSECATDDDRILSDVGHLIGKEVVVSEKKDGESSSLYSDYIHARSLDSKHHWTQDWLRSFHCGFKHLIPDGWRVCGENLFAKHSLKYTNLKSYFYCFSIWNENNICLSWDETIEWCSLLGIEMVPMIYRGIFDEEKIKEIEIDRDTTEGYVVRVCDSFAYGEFSKSIAKFVRKNHVQDTVHHWKSSRIEKNELEEVK